MQNSTGCRINVSSQFNPNDQEREISLAGSRDAINRARQAIDEKVEASVTPPPKLFFFFLYFTFLSFLLSLPSPPSPFLFLKVKEP